MTERAETSMRRMAPAGDQHSPASERLRIVIADDHEPTRALLRALIELEEMQVVGEAEDGDAAITLALEQDADIVLLDVNMPGCDGISAAETIRARRPQTGLFLHSAAPGETTRQRAAALDLPLVDKLYLHQTVEQIAANATRIYSL